MSLQLTSCQARNTFPLMSEFAGYVQRRLGIATEYERDTPWQDRLRRLYEGELQLAWICSKPYALQVDERPRRLHGIAVPVMDGELYDGRPVYYSHLAVRCDDEAESIEGLAGRRVAFNEPGSQSGYFSLRDAVTAIGADASFFGAWVESGAHRRSIDMILAGEVDAAAIDTTLWDFERAHGSRFLDGLKVLDTLGPYPAPPLAAHDSLAVETREALRELCEGMHRDPEGQRILASSLITRFVPVDDAEYRGQLA